MINCREFARLAVGVGATLALTPERLRALQGRAALLLYLVLAVGCDGSSPVDPPPAATGSLEVAITGLPAGVGSSVTLAGPGGYARTLASAGLVEGLTPGTYTATALTLTVSTGSYSPTPTTQTVSVTADATATVQVAYTFSSAPVDPPAATGSLEVAISGLPAGVGSSVTLAGPGGYARTLTSAGLVEGLTPGAYTANALTVTVSTGSYSPTPTTQTVSVMADATATVEVAYAFSPGAPGNLDWIVDSVRVAFGLPALAGGIVTLDNPDFARGVAGARRLGGPAVEVRDLWHLGSNFKAFTGTLAAVAVDQGRIDWTTTVAEAFPDLGGAIRREYQPVTLRDLLSHQSGVPSNPPYAIAISGSTRTDQRLAVTDWALRQAPVSTRGSYNYTNTGYMIAAAMLERALGASFEDAMRTLVLQPLGITDAGWGPQAPAGSSQQPVPHRRVNNAWQALEDFDNVPVYASAGGAHMSIGSWGRFLQEVLRIEAGTPTIVSVAAGRETTASHVRLPFGSDHYGLGWYVTSRSWANGRTLTHNGTNTGNYSVTYMAPLRGFGVYVTTNSFDGTSTHLSTFAAEALANRLVDYYVNGQ